MGITLINTQTAATKEIFLIHNNAIATSLLEDGVPKEVIATALMNTEADSTGSKFFSRNWTFKQHRYSKFTFYICY